MPQLSHLIPNYLDPEMVALRERNAVLNTLSDFAIALLHLTSADEVLTYTANEVVSKIGLDDCVIYLWHPASQRLVQRVAFGHKSSTHGELNNPLRLRLNEGIVGRAAMQRKTMLVNDLSKDPDYVFDMLRAGSELAIPIIHFDQLVGVIDSENSNSYFYTDSHIQILTAISSMVASRLVQTNLISQLESSIAELEYARRVQNVIFNIASLTYEDDDFFKVYEKIHQLINDLMHANSFFVAVYNETLNQIEFPYFVDESRPQITSEGGPVDAELSGMSAWLIFQQRACVMNRSEIIERSANKEFSLLGPLPCSWLGAPINAGGHLKAALVLQSYTPKISFTEKDRDLLVFVSHHVSNLLERKLSEKKLQYLASHDGLTGLANRRYFLDQLADALSRLKKNADKLCAIMYMDLDRFKEVNDQYGHAIGDALLIEFSKLLKLHVRQSDTVARLGGDEFAIFFENVLSEGSMNEFAERIIKALHSPFIIEEVTILCKASIGIVFVHDASISAQEAIRRADSAMYQAKDQGLGGFHLYEESST
ncbi:MAG: diguanylate cyclase [Undibacterium sp.]|nr:diguanylate cyclase [Undibacterium sp.]